MPKKDLTEIVVILDRSGSMATMKADMENGFEGFKAEQAKVPGECRLTLVQFDSVGIDTVHENKPIVDVPRLVLDPRGATPLLDAVGETITNVGKRLAAADESQRPEQVVVLIITDGQENASHNFRKEQISAMVKDQTDKYNWQFVYLGANVDAFAEAGSMGVYLSNAAAYTPSNAVYAANLVGEKVATYRINKNTASLNYSDTERDKLVK